MRPPRLVTRVPLEDVPAMDREITIRVPDEIGRRIDEQVALGDFVSIEEAAGAAVVSAYAHPEGPHR
jgi:hypothetical protein